VLHCTVDTWHACVQPLSWAKRSGGGCVTAKSARDVSGGSVSSHPTRPVGMHAVASAALPTSGSARNGCAVLFAL
jgi:hypothetical protein